MTRPTPSSKATTTERSDRRSRFTTPEQFVFENFARMPMPVRVIVYLLFAFVVVYNSVQPTVLTGSLWIVDKDGGPDKPATNYKLALETSQFSVNSDGRWYLSSSRRLPFGQEQADLIDVPKLDPTTVTIHSNRLARVALCLPFPLYASIVGGPSYNVRWDSTMGKAIVTTTRGCGLSAADQIAMSNNFGRTAMAAGPEVAPQARATRPKASIQTGQQPARGTVTPPAAPLEPQGVLSGVEFSQLTLRQTGHSTVPASIYFKVFIDNKEVKIPGFPTSKKGSQVLLNDDQHVTLNNLIIPIAPLGGKVRVDVFENRPFLFFGTSVEQLATFETQVQPTDTTPKDLKDAKGTGTTATLRPIRQLQQK